ncbi:uncharacterized protein LOC110944837 [Helianthus annuus]|uniref:uncharacterized protein LOC110944837 n=1 Tax=Helianthus annuus TaxID=4232 RepID=UPI000B8F1EB8|nr:uncharacterized protein LOC110944837 [Helianthus annuus]
MERKSKEKGKVEVVCYKCKQKGHYASECKNKRLKDVSYYEKKIEEAKRQQQVSLIAGTDSWQTDDSSDDDEEKMTNFCLMARISDEEVESSECKVSSNNQDLKHHLKKLMIDFKLLQEKQTAENRKSDDLQKLLNEAKNKNKSLLEENLTKEAKIEFYEQERKSLYKKIMTMKSI